MAGWARLPFRPLRMAQCMAMKRTTIYLPDELKAALERTAEAQGKKEAEVVRSALKAATDAHVYPRPRLPLFESGDPTLAERVDEELGAGFGE
jgi:hypothetical protein